MKLWVVWKTLNSRSQWSGIDDPQLFKFLCARVFRTINQLQLTEEQFIYLGLKGGGFYNNIDIDRLERLYTTYNPALELVKRILGRCAYSMPLLQQTFSRQ